MEVNAIVEQTKSDLYKVRETVSLDDLWHEVALRVNDNNRLGPSAEQLRLPSAPPSPAGSIAWTCVTA